MTKIQIVIKLQQKRCTKRNYIVCTKLGCAAGCVAGGALQSLLSQYVFVNFILSYTIAIVSKL